MKIVLHLAVSEDGFIAKQDGDSDWVSSEDEELFRTRAKELGALVVGSRTYNRYKGSIYPVDGALNMVFTKESVSGENIARIGSVDEALKLAQERGCKGILIAGGARTAASFLYDGLVDEVFLSIHPLKLQSGIACPFQRTQEFTLAGERDMNDGVTEEHYVKQGRG